MSSQCITKVGLLRPSPKCEGVYKKKPKTQSKLSNYESRRLKKLKSLLLAERIQFQHDKIQQIYETQYGKKQRSYSWHYDIPSIRDSIRDGTLPVDFSDVCVDFLKYASEVSIITLLDWKSGKTIKLMAPRRGNAAYANKVKRRMKDFKQLLSPFYKCYLLDDGRDQYVLTNVLFFTLTYDHNKISPQEAWANQTDYINAFKVKVQRAFKRKIYFVTSPEGTDSYYPSPHLIAISMEEPFFVEKHVSTFKKHAGKVTYRIPRGKVQNLVRSKWAYGTMDIQGVVGSKVASSQGGDLLDALDYAIKYSSKSLNLNPYLTNDSEQITALHTLAFQKLFGCRTVVGGKLKSALADFVRLDRDNPNSQHQESGADRTNNCYWQYYNTKFVKMDRFIRIITAFPPPSPLTKGGRGQLTFAPSRWGSRSEPSAYSGKYRPANSGV